jgi:predicted dehydrogenase
MPPFGLGIVGVGRHGSRYARHAATDVDGLSLRAVSRRDRSAGEALASELGCDWHGDAVELIRRDDIDAVVLVTVPDLLPQLVDEALAHGKALLIEKPVAPDLESGWSMLNSIESSGQLCLAGHTLRLNSVCRALKEAAPSLGRIDTVLISQRFPPQLALEWLDEPSRSGGGNILHTGVHGFDLIPYLTGLEVSAAVATMGSVYTKRTEDTFAATLRLGDGASTASVTCSRTTSSRNGLIEISGEHGQLIGDHALGTAARLDADGIHPLNPAKPVYTVLAILKHFAACLAGKAEPICSFREGLAAVAVADACYRSAASERFEPIRQQPA